MTRNVDLAVAGYFAKGLRRGWGEIEVYVVQGPDGKYYADPEELTIFPTRKQAVRAAAAVGLLPSANKTYRAFLPKGAGK